MDDELIRRHNEIVGKNDITIHVGDFALSNDIDEIMAIIRKLNGEHIFLGGSHDRWLKHKCHEIWEKKIQDKYIVACHYSMRVWPRSHYGSWLVYGHYHGNLPPLQNQWDVGVDNNNFYPVSFEKLKEIIGNKKAF